MAKVDLDIYRSKNEIFTNAFNSIVAKVCLKHEQEKFKTFLLTGCEPKVGTTTIATELAIALSIAGWKTLLLDCDMRKMVKYKRLGDQVKAGLVDYVKGNASLEEITYHTNWKMLDYISSGDIDEDDTLKVIYSNDFGKLFDKLKREYDYVIMDSPSVNSSVDPMILSVKADASIIVCSLDGRNSKYLTKARESLEEDGANIIGVIQNKVEEENYKKYTKDYDYFINKHYVK